MVILSNIPADDVQHRAAQGPGQLRPRLRRRADHDRRRRVASGPAAGSASRSRRSARSTSRSSRRSRCRAGPWPSSCTVARSPTATTGARRWPIATVKTISSLDYIGVIAYSWTPGGANWDVPLQIADEQGRDHRQDHADADRRHARLRHDDGHRRPRPDEPQGRLAAAHDHHQRRRPLAAPAADHPVHGSTTRSPARRWASATASTWWSRRWSDIAKQDGRAVLRGARTRRSCRRSSSRKPGGAAGR